LRVPQKGHPAVFQNNQFRDLVQLGLTLAADRTNNNRRYFCQ